jgi:predicted permease
MSRRKRMLEDLDQDIRDHIERETRDNIDRGMPPEEARYAALRKFGNARRTREDTRDVWSLRWLEELAQDLRFGLRMLRKSPGFTAVAILTLAFGIGANTAIFSSIDILVLRTLPVRDPQTLVLFQWSAQKESGATSISHFSSCPSEGTEASKSITECSVSYPTFERIRAASDVFSGAFAFIPAMSLVKVDGHVAQLGGLCVSGEFFETLESRAMLGRTLDPSDDVSGAEPVIVLSYPFWHAELADDPSIVGKTALINRQPFRIVGVTQQGFPKLDEGLPEDFWLPLAAQHLVSPMPISLTDPKSLSLQVIGRLKSGVTLRRAAAELNAIFVTDTTSGPDAIFRAGDAPQARLSVASTGLSSLRRIYTKPVLVLMTAVSLVLLLACANVAGLMVARSSARQKEMAVRNAIGAGRPRLIRQLLTESALLAAVGAALGILLAELGAKSLASSIGANWFFPIDIKAGIDSRVLSFTVITSAVVTILFGLMPALQGSRINIGAALKLGGAHLAGRHGESPRMGDVLVIVQVVISVLVLIGAGLMGRTAVNLVTANLGLRTRGVLIFQVNMNGIQDPGPSQFGKLNEQLEERLSGLPGVSSVGYSAMPPLSGIENSAEFGSGEDTPTRRLSAEVVSIGPGFLETLGVPLLAGRTFTRLDCESSEKPLPVIVNRSFARDLFGGKNPLGRIVTFGTDGPSAPSRWRVVGVADDGRYETIRANLGPTAFTPDKFGSPTFELRTEGDPGSLISSARSAVTQINPDLVLLRPMTLRDEIDRTIYRERLLAALSGLFGALALGLACIGLYGLVSYSVSRRTHEIGVRMALGAQRREVLWLTARTGLYLTILGLVAGLAIAGGLTRYLQSFLFGVPPVDPWTFGGIAVLLFVVAACACLLPARRAMRVDPMVALRHE